MSGSAQQPSRVSWLSKGGVYMMLAALFFSLMSLSVKLAGRRLPWQEIVLARAVVGLVLSWALIRRAGIGPFGRRRGLLLLRGILGLIGLTSFFFAITHLALADATSIFYINPIFTVLLAALILRERIQLAHAVAVAVSLAGVIAVARPSFLFSVDGAPSPLGVWVAVAGALASAGAYTTIRALRKTEHPYVVVFYFPLVSVPLTILLALPVAVWPTPTEWLILLCVGVFTQTAQVFMTRSLHSLPAGRAAAISYLQIVFAGIWGATVFGELPDRWSLIGSLLIVGGALYLSRRTAGSVGG